MHKNNYHQPALKILLSAIILSAFAVYLSLAWLTSGPTQGWMLDFIDGWRMFHIDDAYRFFLVRSAWSNPDLYHWSYIQPVALLLDGLLAVITGGDLLLMRFGHALAAATLLSVLWHTARHSDIRPAAILPSLLILAFMPVYAFGFLSFNAENWLAFFLGLALLAWASQRLRTAVVLCALLPLIRPEGIMPLISLAVYLLYQRNFRLLMVLLAPGMLYTIHLLWMLPHPTDYMNWRMTFRGILNRASDEELRLAWRLFSTFNLLWLAPVLLAPWHAGFRRLGPIAAGALIWLVSLIVLVSAQLTFFESRYLLSIFPVLALAWAAGVQVMLSWLPEKNRAWTLMPLLLSLVILSEHLLQFDPLKHRFGDRRYPIAGPPPLLPDFLPRALDREAAAKELAEKLHKLTHEDPRIKQILVFNEAFFYALDPTQLPSGVRVVYAPTSEMAANTLLEDGIYGIHPGMPKHNLYYFAEPHANARRLLVYVGYLSRGWQPIFDQGYLTAYLLEYSNRAPFTPSRLRELPYNAGYD